MPTNTIRTLAAMMVATLLAFQAPSASAQSDDTATLKAQIEKLERELRETRARHYALRRVVQQAIPTLRDRFRNQRALETLANTMEQTLKADPAVLANEPAASPSAGDNRNRRLRLDTPPAETPKPAAAESADAKPTMQAGVSAGQGFFYFEVSFKKTVDGIVCEGQIRNQTPHELITAGFELITYDEDGHIQERTKFYVAFTESNQVKTFTVPVLATPADNAFKIVTVVSED